MAVSKTRKVKIMDSKYISPLQMYGPIIQPMALNESIVYDLVRRLYNVQEVDSNKNEVKLTIVNFNDPNRFKTTTEPVKVSTPVAKPAMAPKLAEHPTTPVKTEVKHENVILPSNVAMRTVDRNTATVPPKTDNIAIPRSTGGNSTELNNNARSSIAPAIPLPSTVEEEALTVEEIQNDNVDDSVINDDEGYDEDETEEDSDEASSDGSGDSSNTSTSPSNKKRHNRGKKHR